MDLVQRQGKSFRDCLSRVMRSLKVSRSDLMDVLSKVKVQERLRRVLRSKWASVQRQGEAVRPCTDLYGPVRPERSQLAHLRCFEIVQSPGQDVQAQGVIRTCQGGFVQSQGVGRRPWSFGIKKASRRHQEDALWRQTTNGSFLVCDWLVLVLDRLSLAVKRREPRP